MGRKKIQIQQIKDDRLKQVRNSLRRGAKIRTLGHLHKEEKRLSQEGHGNLASVRREDACAHVQLS